MAEAPSRGLADVVAASTALSDSDEGAGLPSYRGYDIHHLAGQAGWTAHVIEQHAGNRLIRPDSEHVGERGLHWVPLDAR